MNNSFYKTLLDEVNLFLLPLISATESASNRELFFAGIGWNLETISGFPIQELENRLIGIAAEYDDFIEEIETLPGDTDIIKVLDLLSSVANIIEQIRELKDLLDETERPDSFDDISDDIISYLIEQYLQATKPGFYRLLSAVTLLDPPENKPPKVPVIFGEGESLRIVRDRYQRAEPRLRFIKELLSNPHAYLSEAYRILATLDLTPEEIDALSPENKIRRIANRLFPQLGQLLEIFGFNYVYGVALKETVDYGVFGNDLIAGMLSFFIRPDVNQRAFRASLALSAEEDQDLGLVIIPFSDSFSRTTDRWSFNIYTAEGLKAIALGPNALTVEPSDQTPNNNNFIGTRVTRIPNEDGLAFQIGEVSGSRLEIDQFSLEANINSTGSGTGSYEVVINFGASTFVIDEIVEIHWDKLQIRIEPSNTIRYDISNFQISSPLLPQIDLKGNIKLQFIGGSLDSENSGFYRYEPDANNLVKVDLNQIYLDADCIAIHITDKQINYWLSQLIPGGAERSKSVDNEAVLRIIWGEKIRDILNPIFNPISEQFSSAGSSNNPLVQEIRLDWRNAESSRTFATPIFNIEVNDANRAFFSLIVRGDNLKEIILATSFEPDVELIISSSFAWKESEEDTRQDRELQNDDDNAGKDLFKLTLKAKEIVSLALLRIDLEAGGLPNLLQTILPFLDNNFDFSVDRIDKSDFSLENLKPEDWDIEFDFNLDNFAFPFLKDTGEIGQNIQIKLKDKSFNLSERKISLIVEFIINVGSLTLSTDTSIDLSLDTFSLEVAFDKGIEFCSSGEYLLPPAEHLGLTWRFKGSLITDSDNPNNGKYHFFTLITKSYNYKLIQAPGSEFEVGYGQISEEPITFSISNFELSENGISLDATVTDSPAKLNGIDTKFRFENSGFSIKDNIITNFTLQGTGPLPPDLVGEATVSVALQFTQRNGQLDLEAGSAKLVGNKLLDCRDTRFQFSIDEIFLKFVFDRKFHLYFTLTGSAKFVLQPSDDSNGPLALLSVIEIELIECPLTGDASVISRHIKFLVELSKPISFNFFGCFEMELRGIGFLPQAQVFDGDGAMHLTGQIKFAQGVGDTPSDRYDFHQIFIGLPEPGQLVPRLYLTELPINLNIGSAFKLNGVVGFVDEDDRQGFYGEGVLEIQGLPPFAASFEFLRVRRDENSVWLRAWFLYLEVREVSFKIPIVEVFLREVGLGFGYRFTLMSIGAADRAGNIGKLIDNLKKLSRTQGDLSKRDRWSLDLEDAGEAPRWTIVLRAMIAQTSAATTPTDWNPEKEKKLPCLFLFDAVLALRSDLTFFMAVRGWWNTNYHDYVTSTDSLGKPVQIRNKPLYSGFVLLSPRQKRFLAHVASNPEGYLGDRPPLGPFLESAIRNGQFSATLLIEPGLLHTELGWPNMLRWGESFKGLNVEIRGGAIFRVSKQNLVIGTNLVARGSLEISAEKGGSVGAKISARAEVAYGTRYIGVVNFDNPAVYYYGGIGLEVQIRIAVEFWIRIKIWRKKITKRWRFSLDILFTAALEYGFYFNGSVNAGLRGTSTISVKCMGRRIGLSVDLGVNKDAVTRSRRETERFLNIGLEARDSDRALPVPGTGTISTNNFTASDTRNLAADTLPLVALASPDLASTSVDSSSENTQPVANISEGFSRLDNSISDTSESALTNEEGAEPELGILDTTEFHIPNYDIFVIRNVDDGEDVDNRKGWNYFILYPCGEKLTEECEWVEEVGFLPVPPNQNTVDDANLIDYQLTIPISAEDLKNIESEGFELHHYLPANQDWTEVSLLTKESESSANNNEGVSNAWKWKENQNELVGEWRANWNQVVEKFEDLEQFDDASLLPVPTDPNNSNGLQPSLGNLNLREYLGYAFITNDDGDNDNDQPIRDPEPLGLKDSRESERSDDRVQNPTENSYESAVLGAIEQFRGSPLFKRDPNYTYEQLLSESFSADTTIYSESGAKPKEDKELEKVLEKNQQAHELRGIIIQDMISDLQEYAATENIAKVGIEGSLAFQMGLVFRYKGKPPQWLQEAMSIKELTPEQIRLQIPTLKQRNNPNDTAPKDLNPVNVHVFNTEQNNFRTSPPQFQNVKQYSNSDCIGITWDLTWDNLLGSLDPTTRENLRSTQLDPEHHLQHYQVRRRVLNGNEPEVINTVQPAATVTKGFLQFGDSAFAAFLEKERKDLSRYSFDSLVDQEFPSSDSYIAAINTILGRIADQTPLTADEEQGILNISQQQDIFKFEDSAFDVFFMEKRKGLSRYSFDSLNNEKFNSADIYFEAINKILRKTPGQAVLTEDEKQEMLGVSRQQSKLKQIKPRFQIFDRFNQEGNGDLSVLPTLGVSYLYSITPIDYSGNAGRTLTLIATRYPDDPPQVPTDGQLTIEYNFDEITLEPSSCLPLQIPTVIRPQPLKVNWSEPESDASERRVAIAKYYLVFRKQKTLPIGSYGLDSSIQGSPTNALPTTNARALATDIKVLVPKASGNFRSRSANIKVQELQNRGIFPIDQSSQWRPESWRIFFQTESIDGVLSALAPVQLILRFKTTTQDNNGEQVVNIEEKQPAELEWLPQPIKFPILSPEDLKGQSGEAHFPIPIPDQLQSFRFDPTLDNIKFQPHPNKIRCIRFRWNQGPSQQPTFPINLIARYHLLQLNIDAHTQDTFNNRVKLASVLNDLQEIQMLPSEDLLTTPSDTLTPNQWEAWHPSTIARQIPVEKQIPDSETTLGTWYSWRDSILEWPQWEFTEQGRRDKALHPFLEQLIVDLESPERFDQEYAVTRQISPPIQSTNFSDFRESTAPSVDPYGWGILQRLGLSVTLSLRSETTNELVPAATLLDQINKLLKNYQEDEDPQWQPFLPHLYVTVLSQPARSIELSSESQFGADRLLSFVQISLRPKIKQILRYYQINLNGPSGAAFDVVFQRSQTFSLIDQSNPDIGQIEIEQELQEAELSLPVTLPANGSTTLLIRAESEPEFTIRWNFLAGVKLDQGDDQLGQFFQFEPEEPEAPENLKKTILIQEAFFTASDDDRQTQLSALWQLLAPLDRQSYQFEQNNILKFKFSPAQPLSITQDDDENGKRLGRSAYFSVSIQAIQAALEDNSLNQWKVLQKYLVALDPEIGRDFPTKIPDPENNSFLSEYLAWSQRFIDYGGILDDTNESNILRSTLSGPWLVTAYPRLGTPAFTTPDLSARLTYDHLLEDQWAHNYRFYIRPYSRYHLLWQSLLQSKILYPKQDTFSEQFASQIITTTSFDNFNIELTEIQEKTLKNSLNNFEFVGKSGLLSKLESLGIDLESEQVENLFKAAETVTETTPDPDSGGLDIVLDRTKAIAKPLVLSSQRLDIPSLPENLALPGRIWEVIVAQHPEQALSSQNRTLYNQLSYRRIAFTLLRNFAYDNWVEQSKVIFGLTSLEIHQVEDVFPPIPTQYPSAPDQIDNWESIDPNTALSLSLPKRLGPFQQGAQVLQWEGMPFYYRHLLLLVAQTTQQVSPINQVIQQDFEYRSSQPIAIQGGEQKLWKSAFPYGGEEDSPEEGFTEIPIRHRRVKLFLSRFWDCLPEIAQVRWRSENPDFVWVAIALVQSGAVRPTLEDLAEILQNQLQIDSEKLTWNAPAPSEEQQIALSSLVSDSSLDSVFRESIAQLAKDAIQQLNKTDNYKYSALPDPEVIYQVIQRFNGNFEVQAEYYLNESDDDTAQYDFRQLGRTFQASVLGSNPPDSENKYFTLDTTLLQITEFELRQDYDFSNFPDNAEVSPTRYKINFSNAPFYSLVGVFTKQDRDTILTSLVPVGGDRDTFQSLLDQGLTEDNLIPLFPDESDRREVFQDYETLDRLYRDWFSQEYVSQLPAEGSLGDLVDFPNPSEWQLVWNGPLSDDENATEEDKESIRQALLTLDGDLPFKRAIQRLVALIPELNSELGEEAEEENEKIKNTITVESVPLPPQPAEVPDDLASQLELNLADSSLIWNGLLFDSKVIRLQLWANLPELSDAVEAIVTQFNSLEIEPINLTPPRPLLDELPELLQDNLQLETDRLSWNGLAPTPEQLEALKALTGDIGDNSFISARDGLVAAVEVDISVVLADDPAGNSRPTSGELSPPLRDRLQIETDALIWISPPPSEEQRQALEEIAGFDETFLTAVENLIDAIDANAQLSFPLSTTVPRPRQNQLPPSLQLQLRLQPLVQPTTVRWQGRFRNQDQLDQLSNLPGDGEFKAAIASIIQELKNQSIEEFYQLTSRPTDEHIDSLNPEVKQKFLIGRFLIRYHGLMTMDEAQIIQNAFSSDDTPNQDAIQRLYRASLERGMQGKKLEIQARRGSAIPVSAALQEETLPNLNF